MVIRSMYFPTQWITKGLNHPSKPDWECPLIRPNRASLSKISVQLLVKYESSCEHSYSVHLNGVKSKKRTHVFQDFSPHIH